MRSNGQYAVEHNSDMANWEEFLAKCIIEDIFGLTGLEKHERPDLLSDSVGVEVTKAYEKCYNIINGQFENASIDVLNGVYSGSDKVSGVRSILIGEDGSKMMSESTITRSDKYPVSCGLTSGDLYSPRKKLVLDALEFKLRKLNLGVYDSIELENWLFVFSFINLWSDDESIGLHAKSDDLLKSLVSHQDSILRGHSSWRGFSVVCVYSVSDAILYKLDLQAVTHKKFVINESKYRSALDALFRKYISQS